MGILDAIYGPVTILKIVIVMFIGFFIWNTFIGTFESSLLPNVDIQYQDEINNTISDITIGLNTMDYSMPFIVVGLLIISLIFAFRTGASVVYAILSIVIWILALILSAVFTNVYIQFNEQINMSGFFSISNYLMLNMKWIVLGWLAIITIVIFSRNKQETQNIASSEMVFG
jgi:hypothetical protein